MASTTDRIVAALEAAENEGIQIIGRAKYAIFIALAGLVLLLIRRSFLADVAILTIPTIGVAVAVGVAVLRLAVLVRSFHRLRSRVIRLMAGLTDTTTPAGDRADGPRSSPR